MNNELLENAKKKKKKVTHFTLFYDDIFTDLYHVTELLPAGYFSLILQQRNHENSQFS